MNAFSRRQLRLLTLSLMCLAFGGLCCSRANAEHPQYWVLGRQQPGNNVQHIHPQGYAYGWFGASARPQAARQTGYYGLYRQWTFK